MYKNNVSTILVVDDHILFREGLMSVFHNAPDFRVIGGAGSVYDGIRMARELKPDIVLMDFNLPDGTGLDATRAILSELPDITIVFLTIYETDANLFAAIRLGAKGFMLKNIGSADLLSSLRALYRGEMAISRLMASRLITEFSHSSGPGENRQDEIVNRLSPRELEVFRELESGASNTDIAERLFISENTVKHHISNVLEKLGLQNRREAAVLARQSGFRNSVPPNSAS